MRGKIPPTLTKVSLGEVSAKDSNILISGKSAVTGPVKPYHIKNNNTVIATTNLNSNMIKLRSK